jgi:hypothetical protein
MAQSRHLAPTQTSHSIEMLTIDPRDLAAAVERDTLAVESIAEGRSSFKVLPGGKPNEEH